MRGNVGHVQRGQRHVGALQDMAGLATGRRAGIEYALAGLRIEQACRPLRAGILHRHMAFVETGERMHRHRLVEGDGIRTGLMRRQPGLVEAPQIARHIAVATIDAQGERRVQQAGVEDALPAGRVLRL